MIKKLKIMKKNGFDKIREKMKEIKNVGPGFKKGKEEKNIGKKSKKVKKSNLSIKAKLIVFSLIISVFPILIVGGYSYTRFQSTIQNKVGSLSEQLVKQNSVILNSKLNEVENAAMLIRSNRELQRLLGTKSYDSAHQKLNDSNKMQEILWSIITSNPDIRTITILRNNKDIISVGNNSEVKEVLEKGEFQSSDLYKQIKGTKRQIFWVPGFLDKYTKLHAMRGISDYFGTNAGILILEIETSAIDKLFDNIDMGEDSKILMIDSEGNVIYNKQNGEEEINGIEESEYGKSMTDYASHIPSDKESGSFILEEQLVAYKTWENGWKMLSVIPLDYLMGDVYKVGTMTVIIAIICLIVSIVLSLYITFNITNPLEKIMKLMNRVEKGDLTVKSELVGNNEIGKLSMGFNNMIDSMRKLINDTNRTFKSVKGSTKYVDEIAEQYTMVSEQVAISMGEIANGSTEQAKNAEDTTHIMGQLSSRIDNMIHSINVVKEATGKTKEISGNATNTVKNLYEKTEEYAKISSNTKETISKLRDSVSQIINIVDLIKSISEQTNLLALNAAIEAARSGEAGKGFAVVADEIRKLAEQSKEATNKITDLAKDINDDVIKTVESVEEGDKIFGEQHHAVSDTDAAFKNIMESIESIISEVEDVNNAVQDIERYKNKTIDSVENIAAVTEEAAAGTEEVMASTQEQSSSSQQLREISKELISLVDKLNQSMEKFKVDNKDLG